MKLIFVLLAVALLIIGSMLSIYKITINDDGYNILAISRITGSGTGIICKDKFEIWQIAETVHGGRAEKPLYYGGRWWK